MAQLIGSQRHGPVLRLTLRNPPANALSVEVMDLLQAQLDAARDDEFVRVVVIAAAGKLFCAGHDLKEMTLHRADSDGGKGFFEQVFALCSNLMQSIVNHPKPVIAEIDGIATAAGCQLVASCDLAIASDQSKFGVNGIEPSRRGATMSRWKLFQSGRRLLIGVRIFFRLFGRLDIFLRLLLVEVALDGVEDAVYELCCFVSGKTAGNLECLVDCNCARRGFVKKLVHGEAQDIAIDNCHSRDAPVFGARADALVKLLQSGQRSGGQSRRKVAGWIFQLCVA